MNSPEFPPGAQEWPRGLSRRKFARLAAASAALAGTAGCTRQPLEKIIPYVKQPELVVPGKPLYFATAMVLEGLGRGIIVESHTGRPTKIEGNPDHPASLGATDAFMQAAVLELYDPNRSKSVRHNGSDSTWAMFETAIRERLESGPVFLLTEKTTSPALIDQIRRLRETFPEFRWHHYDPLDFSTVTGGPPPQVPITLDDAEVIVALDADLFGEGLANLAHIRTWARQRHLWENGQPVKLYVAEPDVTITGAMADHRLPMRASEIAKLAEQIISGVVEGPEWVRKVVEDLRTKRGLLVAGPRQPAAVHEMIRRFQETDRQLSESEIPGGLAALTEAMRGGEVETLLVFGGNPAVNAPVDLGFAEALKGVPFSAHLSLYEDQTSGLCQWHLPQAHFLETWSDIRAFDGRVTIMQPLIEPLYGGRSAHELVAAMSGDAERRGYGVLRDFWDSLSEEAWRTALAEGVFEDPRSRSATPSPAFNDAVAVPDPEPADQITGLEISFRADPCLHDGRFARNSWLQELPAPLTKLTWGNAVIMGSATAGRLGVENEDVVELSRAGRSVRGPVMILPGHVEDAVTVHLGHGGDHGFDAYPLRTMDAFWFGDVLVEKTGEKQRLITTQHHQDMEGRHLVRHALAEDYRAKPSVIQDMGHPPAEDETFYPPSPLPVSDQQWGMAINLNTCVGCNACILACQAENNIPVVGPEQVALGREMHWIRIDTYFEESRVHFQPVPCMHCENAPCELVCPVAATVHDSEGLNVQVYNRCIGTRYCSNNCPYKVRRFNFLEYNTGVVPPLNLQKNPNVTVRSRGVMEKCTYCVQRISAARIEAKKEDRSVRDGEIVPACAQACPAEAIVFGDINDPESEVSKWKASPLNYALLGETNVRPRTTYLGKITHG